MSQPNDTDIQFPSVSKVACHNCGWANDVSQRQAFGIAQCTHCGAAIPVPGRLEHFVLIRVLGRDPVSVTYQAHDDLLGRQVAIRVLRPEMAEDAVVAKAFGSEARALASLNHPNVVRVYSLNMTRRPPYAAMELVPARHLGLLFGKGQPVDELRALDITIQVVEALDAAHGVGLVHGDIRPEKIRIDEEGTAKLADFGRARAAAEDRCGTAAVGTAHYLAPEQVSRGPIDHRTDIYGLGATLFHALSGVPAFRGRTAEEIIQARLRKPAPGLREVRASVHRRTADVVARMLQAKPERRYPTYEALLADLREARRAATKPQTPPPPTSKALELAKAAALDWERDRAEKARAARETAGEPPEPLPQVKPLPGLRPKYKAEVLGVVKPAARAAPVPQEVPLAAPIREGQPAEGPAQPPEPAREPARRRLRPIIVSAVLAGIGGVLVAGPYLLRGAPSAGLPGPESRPNAPQPPAARVPPASPPPPSGELPALPPVPPLPDVFLSDLRLSKDTVAQGQRPRKDRNVEGGRLTVNGKTYNKGLGVHAPSALVFPRQPRHVRFVAVVGIDEVSHPTPQKASIVCEIRAGRRLLAKSPVLRWNGRRHWHFDVRLPPKCKKIRLVVTDAGDGPHADLANWVNAGFKQ